MVDENFISMRLHVPDDTRKLNAENQPQAVAEVPDNTIRLRSGCPQIVDRQAVHQRRDQSRLSLSLVHVAQCLYDRLLEAAEHLTVKVGNPLARC